MVKYQACLHLQLNTSEQMGWIQIIEEKHDKIMSIDILRIKMGEEHLSVTILLMDDQF